MMPSGIGLLCRGAEVEPPRTLAVSAKGALSDANRPDEDVGGGGPKEKLNGRAIASPAPPSDPGSATALVVRSFDDFAVRARETFVLSREPGAKESSSKWIASFSKGLKEDKAISGCGCFSEDAAGGTGSVVATGADGRWPTAMEALSLANDI